MSASFSDSGETRPILVKQGPRAVLVLSVLLLLASLSVVSNRTDGNFTGRLRISATHVFRPKAGVSARLGPNGSKQQSAGYIPRSFPSCACQHKPEEGCGFLAPLDQLVNNPAPIRGQAAPCILQDRWLKAVPPVFSIILTVWNQQHVVEQNIQAIMNHTTEAYELIVVFDGCWDASIKVTTALLARAMLPQSLVHILLIEQATPVGETSANNIGMRAATPGVEFFVLLQDDMQMTWHGWNTLLAFPARLYDDVISVSGRCAHSFKHASHSVGRCGKGIDKPLSVSDKTRCTFHVRDTVNRGPLLLYATRMIAMGYFDEVNFVLGDDDRDLHARAWLQHNWVAGWMPLDFSAPLSQGGTRRQKGKGSRKISEQEARYLAARQQRRKNTTGIRPETDHDDDREVPEQYGCTSSSPVWYINATRAVMSSS